MAQTKTSQPPPPETETDPVALFELAQTLIAERNPNMTEAERQELADLWAEEVNARIRARVERMREPGSPENP